MNRPNLLTAGSLIALMPAPVLAQDAADIAGFEAQARSIPFEHRDGCDYPHSQTIPPEVAENNAVPREPGTIVEADW